MMNPLLSPHALAVRMRRGGRLKFELIAVLVVKAALLFVLKMLFFSHPAADNMQMPPAAVAQSLFAIPVSAEGPHHAK
jgi:hypothetical protein